MTVWVKLKSVATPEQRAWRSKPTPVEQRLPPAARVRLPASSVVGFAPAAPRRQAGRQL